jgi:hypothetical protein
MTTGVWKLSGLGIILLSLPNHASGQKDDGLGSSWFPSMTRLGNAESGVSI